MLFGWSQVEQGIINLAGAKVQYTDDKQVKAAVGLWIRFKIHTELVSITTVSNHTHMHMHTHTSLSAPSTD